MIVDLFLVYNFLKRLATPFESWDAYKKGVIDKDGKILIAKRDRDNDQKKAFGVFDLMVLKLKKLIEMIPGSQASKMLASYAAALYLIKEHNMFQVGSVLSESVTEESLDSILEGFSNGYSDYTTSLELVNQKMQLDELFKDSYSFTWHTKHKGLKEDGEVPTNNVGSGNIAGVGVGPDGEPGISKKNQKKHRRLAAMTRTEDCDCEEGDKKVKDGEEYLFHKPSKMAKKIQRFRQFESRLREGNMASDNRDNLQNHGVRKTVKQPKKPKAPIA